MQSRLVELTGKDGDRWIMTIVFESNLQPYGPVGLAHVHLPGHLDMVGGQAIQG
jgi:hypothetical protein